MSWGGGVPVQTLASLLTMCVITMRRGTLLELKVASGSPSYIYIFT